MTVEHLVITVRNNRNCLLLMLALSGCVIGYLAACAQRHVGEKPKTFVRKECSDCHADFVQKYETMPVTHPGVTDGNCESCHLRHGIVPKLLLKREGNQLCYTCHTETSMGMDKAVIHTALKRGQCVKCHDPHGSSAPHLLLAAGAKACYQCHKKENFEKTVVHQAMEQEGCLICHQAHSADEPGLLKSELIALCFSCHDKTQPAFQKAHGGYPVENASCGNCHNFHASVQPGLLRTSVHPQVATSQCEECHNPSSSSSPLEVKKAGSELCYTCHRLKDLKQGDVVHDPFQKRACQACHDPHASEQPNLFTREGNELCFACHGGIRRPVEMVHRAVIEGQGCLSCHQGHAAGESKLLAAREKDLCFSCHEEAKTAVRPEVPHDPFVRGACTSCHDSHGSQFIGMLKNPMTTVCYGCHLDAEVAFAKTHVHKPVIDGQCNACHASHGARHEKMLKAEPQDPELCSTCHGTLIKKSVGGSSHPLFRQGECVRCHEIHAGNQDGLLVQEQGVLCQSCHGTDPGRTSDEVTRSEHSPVVQGRCTDCHNPHKASLDDLLLAGYPDLCLACHVDLKPVTAKTDQSNAVIPGSLDPQGLPAVSEQGALYVHAPSEITNCRTCHDPHVAGEPALLNKPIQRLCSECHDLKKNSFSEAHLFIDPQIINCRKCHLPHIANNQSLFKDLVHKPFAEETCADCHDVKKP